MAQRFTIPFVSHKGVSCRIDIYDATYTGDVTTISSTNASTPGYAAETPVVIEEDDSQNLLNVLRYKTGYINLIESSYGSLQSLYPQTNTQIQVYVYYGTSLVFFGYIQAQSFENEWGPGPRDIKLPIFSPLAVMEGEVFSENASLSEVTLGECLYECLFSYNDVILPKSLVSDPDSGVNTPLQIRINPRIVCPFNESYGFGIPLYGVTPSLYAPITYEKFLTAFCNLYGLVAHEFGKTIVFSKYEYTGQYVRMQVSELEEDTMDETGMPTGADVLSLETYFNVATAGSKESIVMPINKLTYNYGDYIKSVAMDLSRSIYRGRVALDNNNYVILEPQTSEFASSFFTTNGGTLSNQNHVRVLGDGSREVVEMNYRGDQGSDIAIFSYTFCNIPDNAAGATIKSTFTHESGETAQVLRMTVMSGGLYFDDNHDWVSTPYYHTLTFDEQGECKTYDVASNGRNVKITIYPNTTGSAFSGVIEEFVIETFADPLAKYTTLVDNKKVVKNETPGQEDAEVEMLMHDAISNDRTVIGGDIPLNRYLYLFTSQLRHMREVEPDDDEATDMALIYLRKISTTAYDKYFRVIAVNFDLVNDLYSLTMHGSQVLD